MEKRTEEKILRKLEEIERLVKNKQKSFMNLEEVSLYIGISKNSVYAKTHNNEIPFYRVGRRLIFKTNEIDVWILDKQKKTKSSEEIDQQIATELLIKDS